MPTVRLSSQSELKDKGVRAYLRGLPSLVGEPPAFDAAHVPASPEALFLQWLHEAEEAGVEEPHALTLSTLDDDGTPDARVLILKDLTPDGLWCFAGNRDSTKGRQLTAHPAAALTFHWRQQLRSVRVRGTISEAPRAVADRDYAARSANARAVALLGGQSTPLTSEIDLLVELDRAREQVSTTAGVRPDGWTVWQLDPMQIEFWQGATNRLHIRVRYQRTPTGWSTQRLRP